MATRKILNDSWILTGKRRQRRRIEELESKVVFMQRAHKDQIEGLQQTIKLLKDDMEVVSRRVAVQS